MYIFYLCFINICARLQPNTGNNLYNSTIRGLFDIQLLHYYISNILIIDYSDYTFNHYINATLL